MIIKCKMCGGDIEFTPGDTYGTCAYCGSTSTIPKGDDENKLNRYNRANHFRRQCEFDKALASYEKLLEQDDTDAEAHWGAVLSKFGIEYVEDPATNKRIPTCHRVQMTSILADNDYKAAVDNAPDAESRSLYVEEATRIAEIQKGILAVSANEKPYDVFICYKETDENGQRTRDSQWAQDIYYGLTEQGYKVFFSRITLEDKLGQEYEPYIFAALNSAKVMVVIGSKPEYFNAVWVKNEWGRYLALMATDRKRLLIPCYRDMDPYDLPEELSSLQSQDMGRIGFLQDLIRGIKKALKIAEEPYPTHEKVMLDQSEIIERQNEQHEIDLVDKCMQEELQQFDTEKKYIEEEIKRKKTEFANKKVFVRKKIQADFEATIANLQNQLEVLKSRSESVRIRNYAYDCAVEMAVVPGADHGKLDSELAAYKTSCTRSNGNRANGNKRTNSQRNEATFNQAVRTNEPGDVSEQSLKTAAGMFDAIKDDEAAASAKKCRVLAEQARQKTIYTSAVTMRGNERNNPSGLEKAAQLFMSVSEYKDAKAQAQRCFDEAESIRAGLYNQAVAAMNAAGSESSKWDVAKKKLREYELNGYRDVEALRTKAAKRFDECLAAERDAKQQEEERLRRQAEAAAAKKKHRIILAVIASSAAFAVLLFVILYIIPKQHYDKGVAYISAGQWDNAKEEFLAAGNYSNASEQAKEADYQKAMQLLNSGNYEEAILIFNVLRGYSDFNTQYNECIYRRAEDMIAIGDYDAAFKELMTIRGYKDVDTVLETTNDFKWAIGNYVTYKDNEWIIIWKENGNAVLLSRYSVDRMAVRSAPDDFTEYGNGKIVKNRANQIIPGSTILTQQEVEMYLPNASDRIAEDGAWWLANNGTDYLDSGTPYVNKYMGETVSTSGSFRAIDSRYESGVRPALTVSLETLKQYILSH